MKIKYKGTQRIASIKEALASIFSIHYFDNEETPKAFSIILMNREWYWDIGEWEDDL